MKRTLLFLASFDNQRMPFLLVYLNVKCEKGYRNSALFARKTLYVKPFLNEFESKRKIRRKERWRNAFNKA
jgi:hypothetical protein